MERRLFPFTVTPDPEIVPGEHSEPRCGNVPLTRTPGTTPEDGYAP